MPMAKFDKDVLTGGMLKEVGEAIANRVGRRARFLQVGVDQVSATLTQGKADGLCYVLPIWIDGDFDWSQPFLPDAELLAARADAPPIHSLADLRGKPVGTIIRYRYPRIEHVLGEQFVRVDSLTMERNLSNIANGTVQYAVVGQSVLAYQMRINKQLKLRPDLVFISFKAQCAFSRLAKVPFKELDEAINALVGDGTFEHILQRYR